MSNQIEVGIIIFLIAVSTIFVFAMLMAIREHRIENKRKNRYL